MAWTEAGQAEGPGIVSGGRRVPLLRPEGSFVGTGESAPRSQVSDRAGCPGNDDIAPAGAFFMVIVP